MRWTARSEFGPPPEGGQGGGQQQGRQHAGPAMRTFLTCSFLLSFFSFLFVPAHHAVGSVPFDAQSASTLAVRSGPGAGATHGQAPCSSERPSPAVPTVRHTGCGAKGRGGPTERASARRNAARSATEVHSRSRSPHALEVVEELGPTRSHRCWSGESRDPARDRSDDVISACAELQFARSRSRLVPSVHDPQTPLELRHEVTTPRRRNA